MSSASAMRGGALALDPRVVRAWRRHRAHAAYLVLAGGLVALWVLALPHNPPFGYQDEPSTAYNAWLIAQTGRDEYGAHLPLFFQAFGEYRSPVQFYVMAGLIKLFGAHLLMGRYLTRAAVLLAVGIIAWLAARATGRREVGLVVGALGLTTPMLYEVSRLGTEGPLVVLPLAVFLLLAERASRRERWSVWTGLGLAVPLAVMAYTYPSGRPMAPLLALGTAIMLTRRRLPGFLAVVGGTAVLMAPILAFMVRHPGALTGHPGELTWYRSGMGLPSAAWQLVSHLARNLNPYALLFTGDPNPRHHVGAWGALLVPMLALAAGGLVLSLTRLRRERFWPFVAFGTLVALIPPSLTRNVLHEPRMIAVPILLLVLCVPAVVWLLDRRVLLAVALAVTAAQAAVFAASFVSKGTSTERHVTFQADFAPAWRSALNVGGEVWLLDNAYIHGFWRGAVEGIPRTRLVHFVRSPDLDPYAGIGRPDAVQFSAPPGATVIAGEKPPRYAKVLFSGPNYVTWIQP